jgi:hypothetical protein
MTAKKHFMSLKRSNTDLTGYKKSLPMEVTEAMN